MFLKSHCIKYIVIEIILYRNLLEHVFLNIDVAYAKTLQIIGRDHTIETTVEELFLRKRIVEISQTCGPVLRL